MKEKEIIMDATEAPLGRIASFAAKQALFGKTVFVVNCNDAIVLGDKNSIVIKYTAARARGGAIIKGPHFPKSPERIMKRTIRGMLKYKRGRGYTALNNVKCYNEVPEQLKDSKKIVLKREIKTNSLKLSELSRLI
jgi:large subunit ribosomal protein L13